MNEIELQKALEVRRITFDNMLSAEKRANLLADEFTKLEVQIATILLAFMGLFLPHFLVQSVDSAPIFTGAIEVVLKSFYSAAAISFVFSLGIGLVHLKIKESFWQAHHAQRVEATMKWRDVINGKETYERASAFSSGLAAGKGAVSKSVVWTWAVQTSLLATGVLSLLVLFFIVLFA